MIIEIIMSVHSVSIEPSIRLDLKKVNDIKLEKISKFNTKIVQLMNSLNTLRKTHSFRKKVNNCVSIKKDFQEPYTRMFKLPRINNIKENLINSRKVIRNIKIDALNILGCTRIVKEETDVKKQLNDKIDLTKKSIFYKSLVADSKRLKMIIKDKQILLNE